jgi:hypothetical protein
LLEACPRSVVLRKGNLRERRGGLAGVRPSGGGGLRVGGGFRGVSHCYSLLFVDGQLGVAVWLPSHAGGNCFLYI